MNYINSIKATAMNKDRARIWLETPKLAQYGFSRHTPITITIDMADRTITIDIDPDGDRVVAGRVRNGKAIQILDICMPHADREHLRYGADKFNVYARHGRIVIVGGAPA
jgi:hypothetical protein